MGFTILILTIMFLGFVMFMYFSGIYLIISDDDINIKVGGFGICFLVALIVGSTLKGPSNMIDLLTAFMIILPFTIGVIRLVIHNYQVNAYQRRTEIKRKEVRKMPRIFRYSLYLILVLILWKLYIHSDQIVLFIIKNLGFKI